MVVTTRDRLIDAAMHLFYRNGFHAVGLDQILDEVGVTKTTFYNHFDSRDDLILAVIEKRDQIELNGLWSVIDSYGGDDRRKRALAVFEMLHGWFNAEEFRGCMFINAAAEFPAVHDPVHRAAGQHMHNVAETLRGLIAAVGVRDVEACTEEFMLLVEGAITVRAVTDDNSAATIARRVAELVLDRHLQASTADAERRESTV